MKVGRDVLAVARVMHEDDDFVMLEVAKHDRARFTNIIDGDQFYTLIFVKQESEGAYDIWRPFGE